MGAPEPIVAADGQPVYSKIQEIPKIFLQAHLASMFLICGPNTMK
jgi:hypothetical protein